MCDKCFNIFGQVPVLHLKTAGERILSVDKVISQTFKQKTHIFSTQKSTWNGFSQVGNILVWDSLGACSSLLQLEQKDDLLSLSQEQVSMHQFLRVDTLVFIAKSKDQFSRSQHTNFISESLHHDLFIRLVAHKC